MGWWNSRTEQAAPDEEASWQRFGQALLAACQDLECTARPADGHRYGEILAAPAELVRQVEAALQRPALSWPHALARLLYGLFYQDTLVVSRLATLREMRDRESSRREEQAAASARELEDLRRQVFVLQGQLARAEAHAGVLEQASEAAAATAARLQRLLEQKEAYIREQNRVIAQQQEGLGRTGARRD